MWKSLIILILILNTGCIGRRYLSENYYGTDEEYSKNLINIVKENNISDKSYFIEKADFFYIENNKTLRFIFYVKFKKPDKYLISIRSIAGIEAARIYISKDTVLINDRIRKKLLCGKRENLEKIYNEPYFNINMAFGDLFLGEDSIRTETERIDKNIIIKEKHKEKPWVSVINLGDSKVLSVTFLNEMNKKAATINYSRFEKKGKHIPGIIEMRDFDRDVYIKIKIKRVNINWDGEVDFIADKNYYKEEIK